MSSDRRTSPPRGQSREALVASASELFARKSYNDVYISEIAKEAGVAHGLLSYHFKGKRGVYLAVLEQALDGIVELHKRRDNENTREQRIRGLYRRQIEYRRDHFHTVLAMMQAGANDPEVDALYERARRAAAEFACDILGMKPEPPAMLRIAVQGLSGMLDEATLDWLTHDRDLDIAELEQLIYTATVAALRSVQTVHPEIGPIVEELSVTA
ncbi:TetR/AcrR family transcriptional regulator [Brevibacterium sp. FME17]|uniref:TetR/AcrR family transcriptional regulator n=1 Tax=Brevibacterium sp. FME17 TaxID=2742606 RepID=UPI0018684980|nr:TetR/AcrR family transcriptional regulator [Brevibacterium sp. FME17]